MSTDLVAASAMHLILSILRQEEIGLAGGKVGLEHIREGWDYNRTVKNSRFNSSSTSTIIATRNAEIQFAAADPLVTEGRIYDDFLDPQIKKEGFFVYFVTL
ncbi:MAG: hypothetical protein VYA69_02785 [Gemmatimonadota bacterium]|nr:hypothetical protein [Gemmatimonadota bacterium]